MHYTKLLRSENERLQSLIQDIDTTVREFRNYVLSEKFQSNMYMNKSDILLRTEEILTQIRVGI